MLYCTEEYISDLKDTNNDFTYRTRKLFLPLEENREGRMRQYTMNYIYIILVANPWFKRHR